MKPLAPTRTEARWATYTATLPCGVLTSARSARVHLKPTSTDSLSATGYFDHSATVSRETSYGYSSANAAL